MKTRMLLFCALVILLFMIPLGANAQDKYVPKPNEELYGTWTNESSADRQKSVNFPGGYKAYAKTSDTNPFEEGTEQIAEKWIDSEGNIWYKILNVITYGIVPSGVYKGYDYKGQRIQCLQKVSNSGTVREWLWVQVPMFDPSLYPTKIDPTDKSYAIMYRAKE